MYRVKKALNHNAVVAIDAEKCQEFLILGKGIGFGKKVTEYVEPRAEDTVYSMNVRKEERQKTLLMKFLQFV